MKKLITIILTTLIFIIAGCGSSTPSYQLPVDNKNLASYLADDQIYAFYCPNLEKDICYQSVMYNDADAIKSVTTMGSASSAITKMTVFYSYRYLKTINIRQ